MNKILFSLIFLLTVIQSIGQSNLIHYWHFNDFVSGHTSATSPMNFSEKVKLELFDINGRLITNCENCLQLDISELKTGIYLVRINNTQIEKLVVN